MENCSTYVDLNIVLENYREICRRAGVPVMAVVKADAYGHGAVEVSKALEPECPFFGVACIREALELRRAGIQKPILILGLTRDFKEAVREDIRLPICRYEDAVELSREALSQNKRAKVHIVLDTGMSRIGFQATREDALECEKIAKLPGIEIEGLFSHFATADEKDLTRTAAQAEKFENFDRMLRQLGVHIPLRHLENSAGIMNCNTRYEMVRAGIVIFGLYPSDQVEKSRLPVRPALRWCSRVTMIKTLEPGRQISYGGTFTTEKPTRVATVAAGYADGYNRLLSNRFYVLIRGKKARILGRVCMDQFMVDVTDIPEAEVWDEVTLLGSDGGETITADQMAETCGTISYEICCRIGTRNIRHFIG